MSTEIKKRIRRNKHPLDLKMRAITAYETRSPDVGVRDIAKQFNVNVCSIYAWVNNKHEIAEQFAAIESGDASVEPLASTVARPKASRKVSNFRADSSHKLQFCPCCGVNISAIETALSVVAIHG